MRKVLFFNNESQDDISMKLAKLAPGDEVNVHAGEKVYYEAAFESFDEQSGTASFLIDRFYKNGGESISFEIDEITGIEMPLGDETVGSEDE